MNIFVFKWTNGVPCYAGKLFKVKGKRIYYFPFTGTVSEEINKVDTENTSFLNTSHVFGTYDNFDEAKNLFEKIEIANKNIHKITKMANDDIELEIESLRKLSQHLKELCN